MHLLIILIISFSGMFFELLQPKLLGDIIDHIGNNMFGDIGIIVVLMCLAELVSSLLTYLSTFLMTKVGINVSTELKTKFYNNMIELPSYKLDAMQSGNLLTRYETDINNLSDFLSSYLVSFIMNFFSFLIILYFSFSINIILTCIVIIFLPISLLKLPIPKMGFVP
jgi:ATP-binding cassette subfamily B multidrug efflux pump